MAYDKELDFVEADYFMKLCRRHRKYSQQVDMSIVECFKELIEEDDNRATEVDDADIGVSLPPVAPNQDEDDEEFDETSVHLEDT